MRQLKEGGSWEIDGWGMRRDDLVWRWRGLVDLWKSAPRLQQSSQSCLSLSLPLPFRSPDVEGKAGGRDP